MLAPWKKSCDQPRQHIKKLRHYFANIGPSCQSYGFSVVMYGCENWTIRKAEHQRIDASEKWFWRKLLRVLWTARRSNQSILKEIIGRTEYWWWSCSTLAFGCKELTHCKRPWSWERLKAGGEGDDRWWDGWMVSPTQWTWVWASSRNWWWTRKPVMLQSMGLQRVRHNLVTELTEI